HKCLMDFRQEIGGKRPVVDFYFTFARLYINPCNRRLPPTYGINDIHLFQNLISFGCCAVWGCSVPAYTWRLRNSSLPSLFFGSMPLTACSIILSGCLERIRAGVFSCWPPGYPEWLSKILSVHFLPVIFTFSALITIT